MPRGFYCSGVFCLLIRIESRGKGGPRPSLRPDFFGGFSGGGEVVEGAGDEGDGVGVGGGFGLGEGGGDGAGAFDGDVGEGLAEGDGEIGGGRGARSGQINGVDGQVGEALDHGAEECFGIAFAHEADDEVGLAIGVEVGEGCGECGEGDFAVGGVENQRGIGGDAFEASGPFELVDCLRRRLRGV